MVFRASARACLQRSAENGESRASAHDTAHSHAAPFGVAASERARFAKRSAVADAFAQADARAVADRNGGSNDGAGANFTAHRAAVGNDRADCIARSHTEPVTCDAPHAAYRAPPRAQQHAGCAILKSGNR